MTLTVVALQEDRAIDLEVPKADRSVFVTRRNEAAVRQEGHAAEFGLLRRLHLGNNLQLLVVPEQD